MNLKDKISDCDALVFEIKKEHPEITSITLKLFDCELEEIEAMKATKVTYSEHLGRAGAIMRSSDIDTCIWAYTRPCKLASPAIPEFVFESEATHV